MVLLTVVLFVALLLALVLVHEWGHFYAAKKAGCTVEEFGFGFPPRLWSFMYKGTRYSLNLLPIGGFVKIEGENMDETNPGPTSFAAKSASWRIIILSAGVAMNIVLAIVLLTIQSVIGTPTLVTPENAGQLENIYTYVLDIAPNSPAAQADIKELDRIVRINTKEHPTVEEVQAITQEASGEELTLELERQGIHLEKTIIPRRNPPAGEGAIGISLASTGLEKVPVWQAPWAGIKKTGQMAWAIISQFSELLVRLVKERNVGENITGPIGIAVYTNEVTKMGPSYFLEFAALISVNLAIINILPLPALDGGRILFVLLEFLFSRKHLQKVEQYVHGAGFALLIVLMILITLKDIHRYF